MTMFCRACGAQLEEGAHFCSACGAPIESPQEEVAPQPVDDTSEPEEAAPEPVDDASEPEEAAPQPVDDAPEPVGPAAPEPASVDDVADAPDGTSTPGADAAFDDAPTPDDGAPTASAQAPVPAFFDDQPSPLKRAWRDYQASPHKLMILIKLALLQFVPGVGSLVLSGYAYTWAKEQALGRHMPMPQKIVRPGVLDNGLYIYGVSLVATVMGVALLVVVSGILEALHLSALLPLLLIVYVLCTGPFFAIMYMRTAICGRVRSGANVRRVWEMFSASGKTGRAFSSYWIPALLSGAALVAIVVIAVVSMSTSVMGSAYVLMRTFYNPLQLMLSMLLSSLPLLVVAFALCFFVSTAATIVMARAFGYWMRDFHPETWGEYLENAKYYQDQAV